MPLSALTARDWFAAKALVAVDLELPPARMAIEEYRIADAFLREREK